MEWCKLSDGVLEKQVNGVLLALDPCRLNLRIVVTDYHASPVDLDLAELQSVVTFPTGRPRPDPPKQAHAEVRERKGLKRHVPALLVGAVVALAIAHLCRRRPG